MTLIVSHVSGPFVVHVADRLVSARGPHEPEANKTLVYWARNGFFALSYSGLAYLDDIPTDE